MRDAAPRVPAVEAVGLRVCAPDGRLVLDDLTFAVAPGERVLLVGASGSGKSTLLRAVAGLPFDSELETSGSLRVNGVEVLGTTMTQVWRDVGWVPQDPAAAVCLPVVSDDVAFPCENAAVPPELIDPMVDRALQRVRAIHLREHDTGTLSDGQAQRLGMATATITGPAVLLLDEPTSMLDPTAMLAVHTMIAEVQDTALLLVEHRLDELAELPAAIPERTVLLDGGRIVADGPTARVLTEQADLVHTTGCWLPSRSERAVTTTEPSITTRRVVDPVEGLRPVETLLSAKDLSIGYATPLLDGVDLDLRAGEVTALVGANGSGKSTLLRTLAGVHRPLGGRIDLPGGRPGLIFQNPEHQFVAPTVREEIGWGEVDPAAVERALDDHGLTGLADRRPFRLSGGEKRRVSLAAMTVGDRRVLLADEPMFGLDRVGTRAVQRTLREVADRQRAVLFSCHDLRVVVETADRLIVLGDGRVLADGDPRKVLGDPSVLDAAGLRLPPSLSAIGDPVSGADPADVRHGADAHDSADTPDHPDEPDHPDDAVSTTSRTASAESFATEPPRSPAEPSRQDLLSRRNPLAGLAVLIAVSVAAFFVLDPATTGVLYLFALAGVLVAGRLPIRTILRAHLAFGSFAAGIFCVNAMTRPGRTVLDLGFARLSDAGISVGAALALRVLLIGTLATGFALRTDPVRLIVALHQYARLSPRFGYAILTGHRMLAALPSEWRTLLAAHRMRASLNRRGRPRSGPRVWVRAAFGLLVVTIRRGERIAGSLEARGLGTGPRTIRRPVPFTGADGAFVLMCCAVTAAVIVVSGVLGSLQGLGAMFG